MRPITRCTRCIMDDSSDPTIVFDKEGHCDYCTSALQKIGTVYLPNEEGAARIRDMVEQVKRDGKGSPYDCIMGISGGLDSSYLLYLGHQWGLRVLAVHIDDGYDTQISRSNLKKLVSATGFDYETICPDAEQYNALTLAYMRAGVPNIAIPQDNILFAFLYDCMRKYHIKHFLSGANFALECITQRGNTYTALDVTNIRDIHRRFGTKGIEKLKFISSIRRVMDTRLLGIRTWRPLDFLEYDRDRAFAELREFCDFQYYGRKHLENVLTAFIQLYWFPKKFGVDKRSSHLSSMIVSGQMTRERALEEYAEPLYDETMMAGYIAQVKRGLGITDEEFDAIMTAPTHQHMEYAMEKDRPSPAVLDIHFWKF